VTPAASTRIAPAPAERVNGSPSRARIALLGASGYSGQEFARLALDHPGLELVQLVSREHAGHPAHAMLVGLGRTAAPPVVDPDTAIAAVRGGDVDTIVACLPHGAWRALAPAFLANTGGVRIVDLSSDHRDGADGYVYGQPESGRAAIAAATRVANPGCYPTAATLALLPALEAGAVAGPIMVSAVSGVSGAGRAATLRTSYVECQGGAELYRAGTVHAHAGEMARHWQGVAHATLPVGFAPQIVPMARGLLAVVHAPLDRAWSPAEAHARWSARYAAEPFVRVLAPDAWPDTRAVRGSNRCDVAVTTLHDGRTLLAAAAIDNLVKGAAGQAIQNLNLILGFPESTALPVDGTPW
jgi:N-acetyl-gamma-glutamyl-phosphate reductase